jgi:flagellum-specific peptidoglycan hydrolase FlgJ
MSEKNKTFAQGIYNASIGIGVSPLFVTAQGCWESGWGKRSIGEYNLFGVKATSLWKGKRVLIRTTEILKKQPVLQVGEKIISCVPLNTGNNKYVAELWFRDYDSLHEAILDHNKVLEGFTEAWKYRNDPIKFVELLQSGTKKYATDPNYADNIKSMYKTLARLGIR